MLRPAVRAFADAQLHVVTTRGTQPEFPLSGQSLDDFDRENLLRQLGENRGLIAAPGADLEHLVVFLVASRSVISATMNGCEIVFPQPIGRGMSS